MAVDPLAPVMLRGWLRDVDLWRIDRKLRRYVRGKGDSQSSKRFEEVVNELFQDDRVVRIVAELVQRRIQAGDRYDA